MIGHYLGTLPDVQEDRVLTRKMRPLGASLERMACLVISAQFREESVCDPQGGLLVWPHKENHVGPMGVAGRYDRLCARFGTERINVAVRNRILSNRARRILQNAPVSRDTEVDGQSVGACRFGRGESKGDSQ